MIDLPTKPASQADHILVVDDLPDNYVLLQTVLESEGYQVEVADSGHAALASVGAHPPDLILLDIAMPDMNGYEVCQQLKSSAVTANIPIIFVSALDYIGSKVRAFELGGQDYITKPFQELEVLMRVKNQLLLQRQQQQLMQQNQRLEQEVVERLKAEAEVRQLSLTDALTGLHNRRGFFLLAEQQLKIARRTQVSFYLLFTDLDGLKQVNDTLGHETGDGVIADAAQLLKQTFRDADIVARLGGDEFVILVPACSDQINDFHLRLQTRIDRFNQESDRPYQLSMSVGVQSCDLTADASLESLLAQADKLMYDHKRTKHLCYEK